MGAWGEGNFSNDVALDFLAEVSSMQDLRRPLDESVRRGLDNLDADLAAETLAAADLLASMLGRPAPDEPEHVATLLAKLEKPTADLLATAKTAASAILANSELADLWREDDFLPWESVINDLLARLSTETSYEAKPKPAMSKGGFVCSICEEIIPDGEIVRAEFGYLHMPGITMGRYFHRTCIVSNFESPHFDKTGEVTGSLKRQIKKYLRQKEKNQSQD